MNEIATLGSFVISLGVLLIVYNCLTSLRSGRVAGDDPWQANTLEWYTSSPPPASQLRLAAADPQRTAAGRPARRGGGGGGVTR